MKNKDQDPVDETLLHLRPQSPEEKLLWADSHIAKLKAQVTSCQIKNGELQSELDELRHEMKHSEKDALILKTRNQKVLLQDKDNRIKDLKKTIEQLMDKVIRLQVNK
jgi:chromosome segregation ATPase